MQTDLIQLSREGSSLFLIIPLLNPGVGAHSLEVSLKVAAGLVVLTLKLELLRLWRSAKTKLNISKGEADVPLFETIL